MAGMVERAFALRLQALMKKSVGATMRAVTRAVPNFWS